MPATVQQLLSFSYPRTGHPLLISPSSRARGSLSRGQAEGEKRTRHHEREDLLAQVLGVERAWLFAHPESRVHPTRTARFRRLATRLRRGEPLAQILGEQWFYGRPFRVTRDVLIPRPETELLIELALDKMQNAKCKMLHCTIVDIGTGSGCIAVTLAAELPRAHVIATDISPAALRVARVNARRNSVADRITFLQGNLLSPLLSTTTTTRSKQRIDTVLYDRAKLCQQQPVLVVANLPYLTTAEWRALPRSIRLYEPRTALDGGRDGLTPYRKFFSRLRNVSQILNFKFQILLEIDPRRHRALARLARRMLPDWHPTFHRDLAGRWRVLELKQ